MKKILVLLIVILLGIVLVGCEDFDPAHHPLFEPTNRYLQNEIDDLQQQILDLQSQLDDYEEEVREGFNDELPQIYYSKDEVDQLIQEQIDELDIEIMYGEYAGRDNDYVLVNVNDTVYTTSHISDETIYWGSNMVVIRIGDVYLSYVNRGE